MATDYASAIQAVALRVTKLGPSGAPLVGVKNAYATSQFTRVSFTPEYSEGEEIEERGADGSVCVYYKMPDTLKRVNLEVAVCKPQPEIYEMLADGSLLTRTTETVGWASPLVGVEANPDGIAIEAWSRAIVDGRPAATNPYIRWVFPYAKTRMEGERALENGNMAHSFSGWGLGNTAFGDGPTGDWDLPSASPLQFARDATAPVGINDYVAVTADV